MFHAIHEKFVSKNLWMVEIMDINGCHEYVCVYCHLCLTYMDRDLESLLQRYNNFSNSCIKNALKKNVPLINFTTFNCKPKNSCLCLKISINGIYGYYHISVSHSWLKVKTYFLCPSEKGRMQNIYKNNICNEYYATQRLFLKYKKKEYKT